jgi:AraC-like DNA-binding protein
VKVQEEQLKRKNRTNCFAIEFYMYPGPTSYVAHETGFADQSHFTRQFKRYFLESPRNRALVQKRWEKHEGM